MKVVLPSVGQTATTSLSLATRYMGYKSFHIEEKYVYAHRLMWDVEDNEEFRRAVAGCKIESIALEPPTDSLPHAMQTSPHAKVIMSWRDYPSFLGSVQGLNAMAGGKHNRWAGLVAEVSTSWSFCPWFFLYDDLTGHITRVYRDGDMMVAPEQVTVITYLLQRLLGIFGSSKDNGLSRGNYKVIGEEAYLAHQDEIRRTVPPEQLLEFDPKRHGWAELEQFLGRPAPKDMPFPHPRSKASWTNDSMFDLRMDVGVKIFLIFLFLHVVNFSLVHLGVKAVLLLLRRALSILQAISHLLWRAGLRLTSRLETSHPHQS